MRPPTTQRARAELFRRLHDDVLLLPNAWDPPSAVALTAAGAPAIATTSAGVAWSRGVADAGGLTCADALDAVGRIVDAVDVPVSADVERGYADTAPEIAANVARFVERGAVGLNLEDSVRGAVVPLAAQAEVLRAVRSAVDATGVPAFVNVRTDVFLMAEASRGADDLLEETVERARAYRDAGADGLFVPRLTDPDLLRTLCRSVELPVNTGPVSTDRAELARLGVRRVTWGPGLAMAAYGATRDRVAGVLHGDEGAGGVLDLPGRWPSPR